MASLNDEKYRFLRGEGLTGALPDMWRNYLVTVAGALVDSTEVNDLWLALFRDKGYEGALPDVWRQWLLDNGYTDEKDYWKDVADGNAPAPGGDDIFDGLYWFSPMVNNGNDTITDGAWIDTCLSPKNVLLTSGIETVPPQTPAIFPNHSVTRVSDELLYTDTDCVLGDFNGSSQNYIHGISQNGQDFMTFAVQSGVETGKYAGKVNSNFIGAVLTNDRNSVTATIINTSNSNTFTVAYSTTSLAAINEGFEYPSRFTITFPSSFPRDELIALRDSVGDTIREVVPVSGLLVEPEATQQIANTDDITDSTWRKEGSVTVYKHRL